MARLEIALISGNCEGMYGTQQWQLSGYELPLYEPIARGGDCTNQWQLQGYIWHLPVAIARVGFEEAVYVNRGITGTAGTNPTAKKQKKSCKTTSDHSYLIPSLQPSSG